MPSNDIDVPPCPECEQAGEYDEKHSDSRQTFFSCLVRSCRIITYDRRGRVHHSTTNPEEQKPKWLDEEKLVDA